MKKIIDYIQHHFLFTVILILLGNLLLGKIFHDRSIIFHDTPANPLLICSFIISAYYGIFAAFTTAVIYSAAYIIILYRETDFSNIETINTIHHLVVPITMIIVSPIIGFLKQMSLNRVKKISNDVFDLNRQNKKLKDQHDLKEREIVDLKKKLVSKVDTVASLFNDSKLFNTLEEDELIHNYFHTTKNVVGIDTCGIYKLNNQKLEAVISEIGQVNFSGNLEDDPLITKAMRKKKITTLMDLDQNELSVEKNIIICRPIVINNEVKYIFVVFDLNFIHFTNTNFKIIDIYSEWFENSYKIILQSKNNESTHCNFNTDGTWKKNDSLKALDQLKGLKQIYNLPYQIFKLQTGLDSKLSSENQYIINKLVTEIILSSVNYPSFCYHNKRDHQWYLILVGLNSTQVASLKNDLFQRFNLINIKKEHLAHFNLEETAMSEQIL